MTRSLLLGFVISLQLLFALMSQLLVFRLVGIGIHTDAYVAAQAVPVVFSAVVISALQSAWLPRLSRSSLELDGWRREQAAAQGQALILGGGLMLVLAASIAVWMPLIFPGFDDKQLQMTVVLCLVLLAASALNTLVALLSVALRVRNRFLAAELIAMTGTLLSLLAIYILLPRFGIISAVWIALGRAFLVYLAQLALANWPPISLRGGWYCSDTWKLMRPLLFGASVYKMSPLVDRYWASFAQAGGITTLGLAQSAMGAVSTVLERSVCVPVIPSLSRSAHSGDYNKLRETYRRGSLKILVLVLAIDGAMLVFKPLFTALLMSLLRVQYEPAAALWMLCMLLSGYLFSSAAGSLVVSSFYAMGDTSTPMKIGVAGFAASILIKSAGFVLFELPGLAVAISIYYLGNMAALWWVLEKQLRKRISD